jgi:hypothetical protein
VPSGAQAVHKAPRAAVANSGDGPPDDFAIGQDDAGNIFDGPPHHATLPRMDPAYRPFFAHVWAFCWPWLWWNLVRLTAWRKRTGRRVFVTVDKYGNVAIRYIGDAPTPDNAYTYTPPRVPRWQSPALASDLPCGLDVPSAFVWTSLYILWTLYGPVRDQFGYAPVGRLSPARAPP